MQIKNRKISLKKIILDGKLSDIQIGSSVDSIRFTLGEPDDISVGIKQFIIEKYHDGSLQITIRNSLVILISLYFNKGILKNDINQEQYNLDLPAETFSDFLSFIKWLDGFKVIYKTRSEDMDYKIIELENGITVIFYQDYLYSLQTNLKE